MTETKKRIDIESQKRLKEWKNTRRYFDIKKAKQITR